MSGRKKMRDLSMDRDWTLPMIKNFIKVLMKATLCTHVKNLKNHIISECVWKKIGADLKVNHISLKKIWYQRLHMQLFCTEPIYYNDVQIKLIEYLYDKGVAVTKDIKWTDLVSLFSGYTRQFLYVVFTCLMKNARESSGHTNTAELIDHLYVNHIPKLVGKSRDKILPRLRYKNGNIRYIDTDLEEYKQLRNIEATFSDEE